MPDQFNFGQLTKEMIVGHLKGTSNAAQAAAEIAKKTIISGVQATRASGQDPKETVAEICFGAMSGMLLIEKDLPQAAALILASGAEIANELHIDPAELMTWAMGGIAKIASVTTGETVYRIRDAIEERFQGAGEVFSELCGPYEKK